MSFDLFSTAYADTVATTSAAAAPHSASPWSTVIMFVVIIAIFYFLILRPQSKRAKAQREMINNLNRDDEVVTTGGIVGKITEIEEGFINLSIAKDVVIKIQKAAVGGVLPKGTVKF